MFNVEYEKHELLSFVPYQHRYCAQTHLFMCSLPTKDPRRTFSFILKYFCVSL